MKSAMPGDCSVGNPPVNNQFSADDCTCCWVFLKYSFLLELGSGNN